MRMKEYSSTSLIHPKETLYFIFMVITSVFVYLGLTFSVIGIIVLFGLFLVTIFTSALFIGYIRANGVKLGPNQFPHIYERAEKISMDMGLKKTPDIYVIESSGVLNAFATRFFGKNMVTIYSGIFELIKDGHEEELHFVLAHEFAHIKRNHIVKNLLLFPGRFVPFLAEAYSRGCEYTCDRMAAAYIQNTEAATNGLTMLSVGKELYREVNKEAYIQQLQEENSLFVWLSEKLSTHPPLPKRIDQLVSFFNEQPLTRFKTPIAKMVIAILLIVGLSVASIFAFVSIISLAAPLFEEWDEDWAEEYMSYSNDLERAYYEDDYEFAKDLLEGGADPTEILPDTEDTLLHTAVFHNDIHFLELFLQYGDPNVTNGYGQPLLHYAGYTENNNLIPLLIDSGADLTQTDEDGNTPLHTVTNEYANLDVLAYMLENGADPEAVNNLGVSPLMIAEAEGLHDIVALYNQYID